jgi:hypothetical protein
MRVNYLNPPFKVYLSALLVGIKFQLNLQWLCLGLIYSVILKKPRQQLKTTPKGRKYLLLRTYFYPKNDTV